MRVVRLLACVGLGLCSAACFDVSGSTLGTTTPTLLAVQPADFLGDLKCGTAPGQLRRYVATLHELSYPVDGGHDEFVLPSSPPEDCLRSVSFAFVVLGARYVAEIDGYDRDDVAPLATGSQLMVDAQGQPVTPRWTTTCGRVFRPDGGATADAGEAGIPDGVFARAYRTQYIDGCAALAEVGLPTP